jgi:hypothetical protein
VQAELHAPALWQMLQFPDGHAARQDVPAAQLPPPLPVPQPMPNSAIAAPRQHSPVLAFMNFSLVPSA